MGQSFETNLGKFRGQRDGQEEGEKSSINMPNATEVFR